MSIEQKWINQNSLSNKEHIYFMEVNNQCALCGGELTLSIKASEDRVLLTEKAHCSKCKIKTREKAHILQ